MLVHGANGQEKSYNKIIRLVDDKTTRITTVLERNFKINSLCSRDGSKKPKTFRSSPLRSNYCGADKIICPYNSLNGLEKRGFDGY
jgi:hypothetical protein